ncbi:MAG: META domain-containing protein [Thermomicrobiales bacterium]
MSLIALVLLPLLGLSQLLAQATPVPPAASIPPIVWQATRISGGDGAATEIADPARYNAQFLADGSILMQADCNRATASYTMADGALTVLPGISTLALCPADSHDQAFVAAINDATSFAFDDEGLLVLSGPHGEVAMRASLDGVIWQWEQFQGGDDSLVTPNEPARYTLMFLPGGKLAIGADCNRALGQWQAGDETLGLKIGGMTRAMCQRDSLSNDFVQDLGYVRSYVFRDGKLHLTLKADAGIMTFRAAEIPEDAATPTPETEATPAG